MPGSGELFVAQRLDGIEIRSLPRGIDTEDQALDGGRRKTEGRPESGHGSRERRPNKGDDPGDDGSEQDTKDAAESCERDCFERELQQNVALASSDCLPHTDLP